MLPSEKYHYDFLSIFEDICKIPHGSGNTSELVNFCVNFATENGFKSAVDNAGNVCIYKPASKGYENAKTVVIQGHTDMVCEKTADSLHNFSTDPLKLSFDGEFLSAENTTLGGDDGIAVAYGLALLKTDAPMPALEILLTSDEETGMNGAIGLDETLISGRTLLNIDSEEEGVLLCGCAGGLTVNTSAVFKCSSSIGTKIAITVSGLIGGHSGVEIIHRRLNAAIVVAKILNALPYDFRLIYFNGGNKNNAIPCHCTAEILVDKTMCDKIVKIIKDEFSKIVPIDKNDMPTLDIATANGDFDCIPINSSKEIIGFLCDIPDGIVKEDAHGAVTSLNTGITRLENGAFYTEALLRSSINNDIDKLKANIITIAKQYGLKCTTSSPYSAWEYRENSPLRDKMIKIFTDMFGKKPKVDVIHAGLECGILSSKLSDLDAVSFGPQMYGIHTVAEKINIKSSINTWHYLLKILENLI